MVKNFIFDWSGTLADDLGPVWAATNRIFEEYGKPKMTLEEFREHFRLPFSGFYAEFLPEATEEGLEALYERFFAGLQGEIALLPGAREMLEWCRREGKRVFLLSSIKESHFRAQSERLQIGGFFEYPYVQVADKREKIRGILSERSLEAEETVFVGDMVHDVETARYGRVLSVALLTGYDSGEKLVRARPDIIAQDLPALLKLMCRNAVVGKLT